MRDDVDLTLSTRARLVAATTSLVVVSLAVAFIVLRLTTPGDGARLDPGHDAWRPNGVVVTPLEPRSDGLHDGDVVIAIDGRSLESWAQALFDPRAPQVRPFMGQRITYTVLRAGKPIQVVVLLGQYPIWTNLRADWGTIIFGIALGLVGAFVFVRRPRDRAAGILCVCSASLLSATTWSFGLQASDFMDSRLWWLYFATSLGAYGLTWVAFLHFALVFPRPHALIVRRRWIIPLAYLSLAAGYAVFFVVARLNASTTLDWVGRWIPAEGITTVLFIALALATTISTYRANNDIPTRQRIRWVVFGGIVAAGGGLLLWFIPTDILAQPVIDVNALGLLALIVPVTISISILRYQLFDIDVLINRALVYGLLTASLAVVYFGAVIGLRAVIGLVTERALTGHLADSPVAIVVSTLLIAALFQPMRRRIQATVDRRFYRSKYDAARTLAAFSTTLRSQVDLSQLSDLLLAVVVETMQPQSISLWLRPPPRRADPDQPPSPSHDEHALT